MSVTLTPAADRLQASTAPKFRRVFVITLVAFLIRIALIFAFHTYQFPSTSNHYGFGFETGSIAASLATGHGFGSPFGVLTGPTAWIAPVYPAIVAGTFKMFGLFSWASAIVILIFNSLCSALTVPFIYRIGKRVFNAASAETAAWIWAVVPFFAYWSVTWIWETALSALLCAIAFSITLDLNTSEWRAWAGLGVLWGAIALTSPSLLGFLPASFLYPAWKLRSRILIALSRVALAVVFFAVAISPWLARNEAVFHRPVFLRSNFWFEMSLSNYHNGTGEAWSGQHPSLNQRILDEYAAMGELAFVARSKEHTLEFIRLYPTEFAKLLVTRVMNFWDGQELMYEPRSLPLSPWMILITSALALGGLVVTAVRRYQWGLFALLFLLYPVPYYLTYTNPRYRHPIEPMMVVLTGFFCVECRSFWDRRRSRLSLTMSQQ
jgi:4-amino-4-deoxy-L-arabinose transferase-like glycosyltransferase